MGAQRPYRQRRQYLTPAALELKYYQIISQFFFIETQSICKSKYLGFDKIQSWSSMLSRRIHLRTFGRLRQISSRTSGQIFMLKTEKGMDPWMPVN